MELSWKLCSLAALIFCGQTLGGPAVVPKEKGVCWAMGDPHYRTFDGQNYNFMGNCSYILAKNFDVDQTHPAFQVSVKNEKSSKSGRTSAGMVTIGVFDQLIQIVRNEIGMVRVNFEVWSLPVTLSTSSGQVKLFQSGLSVILWTDFDLTVQYDWEEYVKITVPSSFTQKVRGMCGDFDGNMENDMVLQDGSKAKSVQEMATSWLVEGQEGAEFCKESCPKDDCYGCTFMQSMEANLYCGFMNPILNVQFKTCEAFIKPSIFYNMCVVDYCQNGESNFKSYVCDLLQDLTDYCQRSGSVIADWRQSAQCALPSCQENSHFESCGEACPATCENPNAPSTCQFPCVETCACDEGYILSGNKCVRKEDCGCTYNGRYVQSGVSFWANEQCTQKFSCKPGGELKVVEATCPLGESCGVANGVRGCQPMHYGTCLVTGDPHYITFDGNFYDFQGTCVYELAGVCSKKDGLEPFDVIVQNDGRNKQIGSNTKMVGVSVYGYSINISVENPNMVMVNGELHHLPMFLNTNQIKVYKSGFFAVVETDFGLKVSYDWNSVVMVTVPSTYMGTMCGLCGNFNSNMTDDMLLKNGQVAQTAAEMGQSWRIADTPNCRHSCSGPCPSCTFAQKLKYESNAYCGLLNDPSGPFRECMGVINPDNYYQACLYDVCLYQGKGSMQCKTLTGYTAACQAKGISIYPWRSANFCSAQCQPNSHYEICDTGCGATCQSLLDPSPCQGGCQEGCACNDGFHLSGDMCVPNEQCGCMYKGKYYQATQVFYPDGLCAEECVCNENKVSCKTFSCGAYEKCEVKNGVRSCIPIGQGICSISGDPHYNTFDNQTFNFMGTCTYVVAKGCNLNGTHLSPFTVVVENEKWTDMSDDPNVSVAKLVAVTVKNNTIVLRRNQIGSATVNGVLMNVPLHVDQISVQSIGNNYVISTPFGLKVTYDLIYHVTVTVPSNYRNKTCGLCGNFNGNKNDEFHLPDGKMTKDVTTFGASWKVGVSGIVCDDGCVGDSCPTCPESEMKTIESDCSIITNPKGSFAVCHNALDPNPYLRDCVYDVCVAGPRRHTEMLCHSINAYASDCQVIGVNISNWRSENFCPMGCPANSHYEDCALPCKTPCPGLTSANCADTCAEGCACNSGYFYNGTGCVLQQECSCYTDGQTLKIGETMVTEGCTTKLSCLKSGVAVTQSMACNTEEVCQVREGVRGCYPKQCVMGANGKFSTFNGQEGDVTSSGPYDIIKLCGSSQSTEWFRLVVDLEACKNGSQLSAVGIFAFFDGASILINSKFETLVDGKEATLPLHLKNGVSVQVRNDIVVMEKASVMVMRYDRAQQVTVTVSESVASDVCGACGKLEKTSEDTEAKQSMQNYLDDYKYSVFHFCN